MTSPHYCGHCGRAHHDAPMLPGTPCPVCGCWWVLAEPLAVPHPMPESRDEWLIVVALACVLAALLCLAIWGQAQ